MKRRDDPQQRPVVASSPTRPGTAIVKLVSLFFLSRAFVVAQHACFFDAQNIPHSFLIVMMTILYQE